MDICDVYRCTGVSVFPPPGQGLRHPLEKCVIHRGVSAADRVRLMMQMLMRVSAAHRRIVRFLTADMNYLGLLVVDPDDGVIVIGHGSSSALTAILLLP